MKYQLVTIYLRRGDLFIVPSVRDGRGLQVHSEPVSVLKLGDASAAEIGEKIRTACEAASTGGNPDPEAVVRHAGLADWAKFAEGAKSCMLQIYEDSLKLRATENKGAGFGPLATVPPSLLPRDSSDRTLGEAVVSILEKAI